MDNIFQAAMQKTMAGRIKQKELAEKIDISIPYINDLIRGRKTGQESVRRRIAEALGYSDYEAFLDIGRKELGQKPLRHQQGYENTGLNLQDFFRIPYSDHMMLSDARGGNIEITKNRDCSPVVIYGPSLGLRDSEHLQAFLVRRDTLDPIIRPGSIVVADLMAGQPPFRINEGGIYVLRVEPGPGECSLHRLSWVEKGSYLAIESVKPSYQTIYRHLNEIHLVGQVILSLQTHRETLGMPFLR